MGKYTYLLPIILPKTEDQALRYDDAALRECSNAGMAGDDEAKMKKAWQEAEQRRA